jgi:peptidyl-prolyl cis-trans isomerase A (cyclophilin A)
MKLKAIFLLCLFSFLARAENPVVVVDTNKGRIELELYIEKAPLSVENFLAYVDDKFYDNTIVHRVIKNFVIQAGGLSEKLEEKQGKDPIKNEAKNGLSNLKGTLAMARTAVIDSATTHFFVNLKDNTHLDYKDDNNFGYAVFGKVISGYDIVEIIESVKVHSVGGFQNVPKEAVVINSIRRK